MRKSSKKNSHENNVEEDKVEETNDNSSDVDDTEQNGNGDVDEEEPQPNNKLKRKSTTDKDEDESEKSTEKPNKKQKKSKAKKEAATEEAEKPEEEYEVEKIVGHRTIKGRRQFKVRWVGYESEHDTWENEKTLNCQRLIDEYLAEQEEAPVEKKSASESKKSVSPKKGKKTPKKEKSPKKQNSSHDKEEANGASGDEEKDDSSKEKEYEVEKILEVHFKKDKSREFLIRWKGFKASDDTWEPEENLNCRRLIEAFMEKVDTKKQFDTKELRVNPSHTKRFTLTMHGDKRQSRRNANKQRQTYHED